MRCMAWGADRLDERELTDVAEVAALRREYSIVWIDVVGLADVARIEQLGEVLGLHHLALEDVFNVPQRAKAEPYPDHTFVVVRSLTSPTSPDTEQMSIFLGDGWVVTFQERPGDCLDAVRKRIRDGRPRLRSGTADYLAYALLDVVIDAYFPLVEGYHQNLEDLEDRIIAEPATSHANEIHRLKRELAGLRPVIWPLREVFAAFTRGDDSRIRPDTLIFLRDAADHANQLRELIDSYVDSLGALMDLDLALTSQRMNEVMKVLTVIATIFMPLSFIAGVYGMNFDPDASRWNMPELRLPFGYAAVMFVMATIAGAMLAFFRRRGWFR